MDEVTALKALIEVLKAQRNVAQDRAAALEAQLLLERQLKQQEQERNSNGTLDN